MSPFDVWAFRVGCAAAILTWAVFVCVVAAWVILETRRRWRNRGRH